jgi:hypothetical protein
LEACAYCLLKELFCGGPDNYEIDHFRPQSLFPELRENFYNLYYSCHVCNRTKHDKWPPETHESRGCGFVNLCLDDFDNHFHEGPDGSWEPLTTSAKYTIDQLRLNRPQLKTIRLLLRTFPDLKLL